MYRPNNREPDFQNIVDVVNHKVPSRPTLFEMMLNPRLLRTLTNEKANPFALETIVRAYDSAGYDYVTLKPTAFTYIDRDAEGATISLNDNSFIYDRESFDKFKWRNPDDYSLEEFLKIPEYLPKKMKVVPLGSYGILENVIAITGYENLCMMIYDDEELVYDIFEKVGTTMVKYYSRFVEYDFVGALMSNDDWGFNTQPLLSPADLRRFVFPWHKKTVELAHEHGKLAFLHSCGNYTSIIDDVINDMKYDARHSYEDTIIPVETAYETLRDRIAIFGGIDVDYMTRHSLEDITNRSRKMVEKQMSTGSYALGTGNSVPEYISDDHYFAMTKPIFEV